MSLTVCHLHTRQQYVRLISKICFQLTATWEIDIFQDVMASPRSLNCNTFIFKITRKHFVDLLPLNVCLTDFNDLFLAHCHLGNWHLSGCYGIPPQEANCKTFIFKITQNDFGDLLPLNVCLTIWCLCHKTVSCCNLNCDRISQTLCHLCTR